ncbi:hypothetical protein COOONC_14700 [Cooperia oncophora]
MLMHELSSRMRFVPVFLTFYSLSHCVSAKIDHQDVKHHHKTATKSKIEDVHKHVDLADMRKSYTELFKGKRRDQLGAIESIVNIEESKRRRYVEEVSRGLLSYFFSFTLFIQAVQIPGII